jgi:molecular chaperone GrpE (heat shock protein)
MAHIPAGELIPDTENLSVDSSSEAFSTHGNPDVPTSFTQDPLSELPSPQAANADAALPTRAEAEQPAELPPPALLIERLDALQTELVELKALFLQQNKANDLNRIAFDRLHKEMQDYKDNFLARAQEPMYRALIALDDDIGKTLQQEREITRDDCQHLRNEVEEILARQDVEPFVCEAQTFDPALQKAVRTEPTTDAGKHRQIALRLRRGFKLGERILRSEYVSIFVHTPASSGEEQS